MTTQKWENDNNAFAGFLVNSSEDGDTGILRAYCSDDEKGGSLKAGGFKHIDSNFRSVVACSFDNTAPLSPS